MTCKRVPVPVDSPWALVGLDVHLVVVDVHLWDFHLKVVGQQLDGLAHSAHAWPARGMEHLLQGWGEDPHGHWTDRQTGRKGGRKGGRHIINCGTDGGWAQRVFSSCLASTGWQRKHGSGRGARSRGRQRGG